MKTRRRTQRLKELTELRCRQENLKSQVYATAMRHVQTAEFERDTLEQTQIAMLSRTGVAAGETINVVLQRARHQYERHLADRIVEQDVVIHELQEVAEEKRVEMHESAKLRKMMETVTERTQRIVDHEDRRLERVAMDETASMRAATVRARMKKG